MFRRIRMRTVRSTSEDLWMVRKHIQTPPVRISLRAGFRVRDSPSTYELDGVAGRRIAFRQKCANQTRSM